MSPPAHLRPCRSWQVTPVSGGRGDGSDLRSRAHATHPRKGIYDRPPAISPFRRGDYSSDCAGTLNAAALIKRSADRVRHRSGNRRRPVACRFPIAERGRSPEYRIAASLEAVYSKTTSERWEAHVSLFAGQSSAPLGGGRGAGTGSSIRIWNGGTSPARRSLLERLDPLATLRVLNLDGSKETASPQFGDHALRIAPNGVRLEAR